MSDTKLLIDRLHEHFETQCGDAHFTCGEAADEIERLLAALEQAASLAETYWRDVEATKEAHYRYTDAPFRYEDFSYDPDMALRSKQLAEQIRSLAAG